MVIITTDKGNYLERIRDIESNGSVVTPFHSIASAEGFISMAVKYDGSLWTWGSNAYGELGDGTDGYRSIPVKIMDGVVAVDTGHDFSIAVKTDGSLWAWGSTSSFGTKDKFPTKIMDGVSSAMADEYDIAFVKSDGSLWIWGDTVNLGSMFNKSIISGKPLKIMDNVVSASVGGGYVTAIKNDNSLWACGRNYFGYSSYDEVAKKFNSSKIMDDVVFCFCERYTLHGN